jgi:hypothetical protein
MPLLPKVLKVYNPVPLCQDGFVNYKKLMQISVIHNITYYNLLLSFSL